MNIDIASFIPKYKPVDKVIANIIGLYQDVSLNKSICSKEEFKELASHKSQKSKIFNHQRIITRLMSSHTPYNELLLYHEMGSGKSCSAIAAIEAVKAENSGIKRALILAKGSGLLESFKKELISLNCTDGQYIPENYAKLNADTKVKRVNKLLAKFYSFNTFETFAKSLKGKSNELIKKIYSNHFIVMDEIHNIRIQEKSLEKSLEGVKLYQEFHRFLHSVEGCKILLLSGTPMKDNVGEIGAVMNLILPLNMQIESPDGQAFDTLKESRRNELILRLAKTNKLSKYLQGRISFMQTPIENANVVKKFMGTKMNLDLPLFKSSVLRAKTKDSGSEPFRVVELVMSDYQTREYMNIYQNDSARNYFINARLASLFTWIKGPIFNISKSIEMGKGRGKGSKTVYTLNRDLIKDITTGGILDLNKLREYSIVYATLIPLLDNAKEAGELSFVYGEFKHKGGLFLLGKLLELHGYGYPKGDSLGSKGKRMVLFEGSMNSRNRQLLDMCNDPQNKNGEYISIILGTRVVMEGYSFKNMKNEFIITPHWNYSETSQAIARGFRARSHIDLNPSPTNKIIVKIFQLVAIPNLATKSESKKQSINMKLYETSFNKDINIKYIERVIKENSIDCQMMYYINSQGQDGSRECEYTTCKYECKGGSCKPTDYSTYNLYYNETLVSEISKYVQNILNSSKMFTIHFKNLKRKLKKTYNIDLTDFTLLSALNLLIQKRVLFADRYGFKSYLSESNDEYYLTTSISSNDKTDIYYTRHPSLVTNHDLSYIITSGSNNIKLIQTLDVPNQSKMLELVIRRLSPIIQERFLEILLDGYQSNPERISEKAKFILTLFNGLYSISSTYIVSWLLENDNLLRCKFGDSWEKCNALQMAELNTARDSEIQDYVTRSKDYGYYGTKNPLTQDFCLVNVNKSDIKKGNVKSVGMRCLNYKNLAEIYTTIIGEKPKTTDRFYLCNSIRNKLEELNLIRFDSTCGSNRKIRVKAVKSTAPVGKGKGKSRGRSGKAPLLD